MKNLKTKLNKTDIQTLRQLETSDYQNRRGNYPSSNVPDCIDVYQDQTSLTVRAIFKNTSEKVAEKWLRQHLMVKVGDVSTKADYQTYQSGNYQDDWVTSEVTFKI